MKFLTSLLFCFLCYNLSLASDTYRAGTIASTFYVDPQRDMPAIRAADNNVDILVLPLPDVSSCNAASCSSENYDKSVKILSELARLAHLYIVAHLAEMTSCNNGDQLVRTNLVFDRKGSIAAVYRKPMNDIGNCTVSPNDVTTFTTDFGVTFGLVMEEDLVLRAPAALKGLKNFVLSGSLHNDTPMLNAKQFASSWAFVNNVNLISSDALYAGRSGKTSGSYADLLKSNGKESPVTAPVSSLPSSFRDEDLSHYIIKPVDLELSVTGYKDTVCHGSFCCQFYLKTKAGSKKNDMNYGLAAFNGVRSFSGRYNIGTQICGVYACAGLYKRSCSVHKNNDTVNIENISISSNFTSHVNYPIIISRDGDAENVKQFIFNTKFNEESTLKIENAVNIHNIAIFGRDYSKDTQEYFIAPKHIVDLNVYDYIFNEYVIDFFDFVWIRLRVVIFVVSIYVLEMM